MSKIFLISKRLFRLFLATTLGRSLKTCERFRPAPLFPLLNTDIVEWLRSRTGLPVDSSSAVVGVMPAGILPALVSAAFTLTYFYNLLAASDDFSISDVPLLSWLDDTSGVSFGFNK